MKIEIELRTNDEAEAFRDLLGTLIDEVASWFPANSEVA